MIKDLAWTQAQWTQVMAWLETSYLDESDVNVHVTHTMVVCAEAKVGTRLEGAVKDSTVSTADLKYLQTIKAALKSITAMIGNARRARHPVPSHPIHRCAHDRHPS